MSSTATTHRVVHRDLKPENLLLARDNSVKIADFGLSNLMRWRIPAHIVRVPQIMPEVICGSLYAGPEVDVWAGVILYALLCGTLPFDDENIPNTFPKNQEWSVHSAGYLSDLARDLIPRMLVVDPLKRITIPEIRQHPWFQTELPLLPAHSAKACSSSLQR